MDLQPLSMNNHPQENQQQKSIKRITQQAQLIITSKREKTRGLRRKASKKKKDKNQSIIKFGSLALREQLLISRKRKSLTPFTQLQLPLIKKIFDSVSNELDVTKTEGLANDSEEKPLYYHRISTLGIFVIAFLRTHELGKIFFFPSKKISRKTMSIICTLKINMGLMILLVSRFILPFSISPFILFVGCYFLGLPFCWILEYLMKYESSLKISNPLDSSSIMSNINSMVALKYKKQELVRFIARSVGLLLSVAASGVSVAALFFIEPRILNRIYFFMFLQIAYATVVQQFLNTLIQLALLLYYEKSFTLSDMASPSFIKSFILKEVLEAISPLPK